MAWFEQLLPPSDHDARPHGLRYRLDFISADEERALIDHVRGLPLAPFQFGPFEGKRRVLSFGSRYNYTAQRLEPAHDIPDWIRPILARIEDCMTLPSGAIRQVLCTEYDVGTGIGWHRDKTQYDKVFGLSLASTCKLRFRRAQGERWQRFTLDAQPRSLYAMTGPSRLVWEHSIPAVEAPRYSITFRTIAG